MSWLQPDNDLVEAALDSVRPGAWTATNSWFCCAPPRCPICDRELVDMPELGYAFCPVDRYRRTSEDVLRLVGLVNETLSMQFAIDTLDGFVRDYVLCGERAHD